MEIIFTVFPKGPVNIIKVTCFGEREMSRIFKSYLMHSSELTCIFDHLKGHCTLLLRMGDFRGQLGKNKKHWPESIS